MGRRGRRGYYRRVEPSRFSAPLSLSAHPVAPHDLPVWRKESELVNMMDRNAVSVITGNTGCGKTTQIPKMILDHWQNASVIVTQPRRLAAISAAKRVAYECRTTVGDFVGYHVHGDRGYCHKTRILYVTVGLFIQELVGMQGPPPWTHIVIDEVHERSMEIDFALVLLKHLLAKFQTTKLILMSATIDSKIFANYYSREEMGKVLPNSSLEEKDIEESWIPSAPSRYSKDFEGPAPTLDAGSQLFKVQKIYLEEAVEILSQCHSLPEGFSLDCMRNVYDPRSVIVPDISPDIYKLAAEVVKAQHRCECFVEEMEAKGSFLVFLPGLHEINCMNEAISRAFEFQTETLEVLHLHSAVPEMEHFRVLEPVAAGVRRVILSTNIAESSLTLGDVRFVLDFGYSKEVTYSSRTFTESLDLVWCSKAAMKQRAGRAGRVANGLVFRLIPKSFHKSLSLYANPEMRRCPLDKLILKVKQLSLGSSFAILSKAIEPPDRSDIRKTERFLKNVGALTPGGVLTWLGQVAADMPCNLNLTRLCLFGGIFGCMGQSVVMAAILSQDKSLFQSFSASSHARKHEFQVFQNKMKWADGLDSDLLSSLNVFEEWLQMFGKGMLGDAEGSFQVRRFSPSLKERSWCSENFVSTTVLRDVVVSAQELRRRLSYYSIPSEVLNSKVSLKTADRVNAIWALKLAIAGAFVGRFMVARYADDRIRKTASTEHLVTVSGCSDIVTTEDIGDMVRKYALATTFTVDLSYGRAEVTFKDEQCLRQMQLFLWTGQYSQRYRQGDFVVIKRTIRRDHDLTRSQDVDDRTREYYLKQVTKQDWRRTKSFNLDAEQYKDEMHQVEVTCLLRPEHSHRLDFSDMKTYLDVLVEEDSVNSVMLELDPKVERNHLLVACQYIVKGQQNGRTYAVQTTHFDPLPLLPQLLALAFESDVSLVKDEQGQRYGGVEFHDSGQVSDINYEFRRRDVDEINQIRSLLSQGLSGPKALSAVSRSNLLPLMLAIVTRQRVKAVKGGIAWVHSGMDVIDLEQRLTGDVYLPPIPALDVKEDARQWDPDWETIRQAEISTQLAAKQNLLSDLDRRVRLIEMKDAELICSHCKSSLGFAKFIKCVQGDVYSFTPLYGSVTTVARNPDNNPLGDKTFPNPPENWVACQYHHIVGWEDSKQNMMIFLDAPVAVLMPTLTEMEFSAGLFENGGELLNRNLEAFLKQRRALKVDLKCQVCEVVLNTEKEFVSHLFKDKLHKEQVARLKSELLS